jgi:Ca-activated chloride channel family protein
LFHNSTRWFDKKVRSADEKTVEAAVAFLLEHKDSGGTNLGVALEQALRIKRAKGECARHLLVVTDAQVSDAGRVLRLADEEAQRKDRRRISVLCIDAAPNAFLALELAERGGGAARFLTSSPDAEDITTALDEVLADWGEPVLSGVRLVANRSEVEAAGRQATGGAPAGWGAVDLGDLPAGRAIWVAGRVPRGDASDLAFRVEAAGAKEIAAYTPGDAGEARQCPAIKALFGARRVLGLEFLINSSYTGDMLTEQLKRLGYDPKTALKGKPGQAVYAENVREDVQEALRDLLVQEALDYGLASAETAFVAVREEAGEVIEGTVVVANALAEGWSDGFATLSLGAAPQGAMRLSASRSMDAAMFAAAPAPASAKHVRMRDQRIESPPAQEAAPEGEPLFDGVPDIANGEAVLFDSSRGEDAGKLPDVVTFSRLVVRFSGGAPKRVDRSLSLLVFVGDLSSPRARVRLSDLLRRGERPLNLTKRAGEVVRVVLVDPKGVWAQGAPQIEVSLGW